MVVGFHLSKFDEEYEMTGEKDLDRNRQSYNNVTT